MEMFSMMYKMWNREGFRFDTTRLQYVDLQNVADAFYNDEKEYFEIYEFPCVTSPWREAWMEFSKPYEGGTSYFGAIVSQWEIEEELGVEALRADKGRFEMLQMKGVSTITHEKWSEWVESAIKDGHRARWYLLITVWAVFGKKYTPQQTYAFYLNQSGDIIPEMFYTLVGKQIVDAAISLGHPPGNVSGALPFLYALSLLNCKNVNTIPIQYPRAVRRRCKRRLIPEIEFKQLVVDPMKPRHLSGPPKNTVRHKTRQHICRGHFRDYRQGGGLFGKYNCVVWVPQHLKGDHKEGVVDKEYIVEAGGSK